MADHLMWHTHGVKKGKKRQRVRGSNVEELGVVPSFPWYKLLALSLTNVQGCCCRLCVPAHASGVTTVRSTHLLIHSA